MSLFSTLDTGYSGLNVSQLQMGTVSHNIANADNDGYSRQRIASQARTPLHTQPGDIGTGTKMATITRVHNEFVFSRLRDSSGDLEYNTFSKQTLEEAARIFPDTEGVGLQNDMKNYFDAWNSFASNPTSMAEKTALAQTTVTFTDNIKDTRARLRDLQDSLNDQIKIGIDEVNRIGKEIADLNAKIANVESIEGNHANDLRDQRDSLEMSLAKLLDFSVFKGDMQSDMSVDRNLTDAGREYYLNIAGESFVDGSTFHPLALDNKNNKSLYYSIYNESQDGSRVDMTGKIRGGKIGALLDLRGRDIDSKTSYPTDGTLQGYIDDLDAFANGIIEKTNSIYASSATDSMQSSFLDFNDDVSLVNNSGYNIKKGTFDIVMYDIDGNIAGKKSITIDENTTMSDIVEKINTSTDDNADNDSTDDIDDNFMAFYSNEQHILTIQPTSSNANRYKIAIEDNDTNFAGAIGLSAFFEGKDAGDISLKDTFVQNPTLINAYKSPIDGDNQMANEMLQIQYNSIDFNYKNGEILSDTPDGFYRNMTGKIAVDAENSSKNTDTSEAIYNAIYQEQQSISGVNIDDELTNLLKYQTAYSANAKIITTIDRMLETLLSIKQ